MSKQFDAQGGVVNFVSSLMINFSSDIKCKHLVIGRNQSNTIIRNFFAPVLDNLKLAKYILTDRFDCVHINPSLNVNSLLRDGLFVITLGLVHYRNIILFFHGWNERDEQQIIKNRLLKYLFLKVFDRAKVIYVLGSCFKTALQNIGVDAEKIRVASTMFDGRIFSDIERTHPLAGQNCVFMSRFVVEKGVYELLQAFNELTESHPKANLILIGDGPERNSMQQWVSEHGISSRVKFLGYLRGKDKAQALIDANLFVFPTYYGEGCPVVLLEAMAAGLPVITHGVGGIPDIFEHNKNGILLGEVSSRSIVSAMRVLLDDQSLRNRIAEYNHQYAWEHYEATVITQKLESVYKSLT